MLSPALSIYENSGVLHCENNDGLLLQHLTSLVLYPVASLAAPELPLFGGSYFLAYCNVNSGSSCNFSDNELSLTPITNQSRNISASRAP